MTTLILSNKKIDDMMKIVKSVKESGWLIKSVGKILKNSAK